MCGRSNTVRVHGIPFDAQASCKDYCMLSVVSQYKWNGLLVFPSDPWLMMQVNQVRSQLILPLTIGWHPLCRIDVTMVSSCTEVPCKGTHHSPLLNLGQRKRGLVDLVSIFVSVHVCVCACVHNHISDMYGPILSILGKRQQMMVNICPSFCFVMQSKMAD